MTLRPAKPRRATRGHSVLTWLASALALAFFAGSPAAFPGALDSSFAGTGRTIVPFGSGGSFARSTTLGLDGRLLVAGSCYQGARLVFAVARYNTDGSLDPNFGRHGMVTTPVRVEEAPLASTTKDWVASVRNGSNGKIYVAGTTGFQQQGDFAVVRYNADGSLDPTFGGDGKVTTALSGGNDEANAMTVQVDGKVLVAGSISVGNGLSDVAVVRYNADGTLDPTFDGDGIATISLGPFIETARGVAVMGDGRIVVVGQVQPGYGLGDIFVLRYNANGTLDTSFDGDGVLVLDLGNDLDDANAVWIQAGLTGPSKILVAGRTGAFAIVVRFNENGTVDLTFDSDGRAYALVGSQCVATSLSMIYSGGNPSRILVGGTSLDAGTTRLMFLRYNLDGSLDTAFDGDGIALSPFAVEGNCTLAPQSGRWCAVGTRLPIEFPAYFRFAVLRYNGDGTLDATFDGDGIRTDDPGSAPGQVAGMARDWDGRVVLAGTTRDSLAVARLEEDGTPDSTFGGDGRVTLRLGSAQTPNQCGGVAVQLDGKVVVVGTLGQVVSGPSDVVVLRFTAGGALDPSFGQGGVAVVSVDTVDIGRAVAIQGDGRIVVGASVSDTYNSDFAVIRLDPGGTLDGTFGGDGWVRTDFGSVFDQVDALLIQPDGRILVGGSMHNGADLDFALARYLPDGTPDDAFNGIGRLTTRFAYASDACHALALQADGRILAAGEETHDPFSLPRFAVARYLPDGTLDASFDGDGRVETAIASEECHARAIAVQTDGAIVVGGEVVPNPGDADYAVVRYLANGALDGSYGAGGTSTVVLDGDGDSYDQSAGMALDPQRRVTLAGTSGGVFVAARLLGDGGGVAVPGARDPLARALWLAGPNPFHAATGLAYSLAEAGAVSLRLYDVSGALVRTLVLGNEAAGPHRVTWDGRDDRAREVEPGMYFARLDARGRMTVARTVKLQ